MGNRFINLFKPNYLNVTTIFLFVFVIMIFLSCLAVVRFIISRYTCFLLKSMRFAFSMMMNDIHGC